MPPPLPYCISSLVKSSDPGAEREKRETSPSSTPEKWRGRTSSDCTAWMSLDDREPCDLSGIENLLIEFISREAIKWL